MLSVLGSQGIAFLGKRNLEAFEFSPLLEFSLPRFDDSVLHLEGAVPHERLSLFDQFFMLGVLLADLLVLLLVVLRLLAL